MHALECEVVYATDETALSSLVEGYRDGLSEECLRDLWDDEAAELVRQIYSGLLACVVDELYLQEFLPFGSMYRSAGLLAVKRRKGHIQIEKVMQDHILLRDVFWELRRSRAEKVHDFTVEKRLCQCFNSLLQATVQAYQTREPTTDILDPLRDQVTGLFNNLYFMTRLEEEVKRSERYLREVTVVLFHVDHPFEQASEQELELMRAVARVLRRNSRASDILSRMEMSRFSVLMPETRAQDANTAADRLKRKVVRYLLEMGDSFADVSIEVGVASYPEHGDDGQVLLHEAEENIRREALEGQ
jgi:diguanylate cyclase (GGDEF)-like protein